jgi:hypothetical protein
MAGFRVVRLPFFPGFYESMLSGAMDSYGEREAEYMADREIPVQKMEPQTLVLSAEDGENPEWQPAHLRISASEYSELFYDCCNYQLVYHKIAQFWVEAFDWWCKENIGTPEKSFLWESMTSPREYNFTTDVVYAYVPEAVLESLFAKSAAEGHKTLAQVIKDSFTSYDGFISFYSNDIETWLEKGFAEWDYNELGSLVAAAIIGCEEFESRGDFSMTIYEILFSGNNEDGEAFDAGMDWPKFEEKVKELRAEKAAEHENETK